MKSIIYEQWIHSVMSQAQVFASSWSMVGGRFDNGDFLNRAEKEKQDLKNMLENSPQQKVIAELVSCLQGLLHEDGGSLAFSSENEKCVRCRKAIKKAMLFIQNKEIDGESNND